MILFKIHCHCLAWDPLGNKWWWLKSIISYRIEVWYRSDKAPGIKIRIKKVVYHLRGKNNWGANFLELTSRAQFALNRFRCLWLLIWSKSCCGFLKRSQEIWYSYFLQIYIVSSSKRLLISDKLSWVVKSLVCLFSCKFQGFSIIFTDF